MADEPTDLRSDEPREESLADVVAELRRLLRDPEFGKRIDAIIAAWQGKTSAERERAREWDVKRASIYREGMYVRAGLSVATVGLVAYLGAQRVIAAEAVVGLLGAFAGYLWGNRPQPPQR